MRDSTKTTIGLGSIWGVFAMGSAIFACFSIGANDTAPEVLALVVSGLGILPCCLLAIRRQRTAALLLLGIAVICGFGFTYQIVRETSHAKRSLIGTVVWAVCLASVPGLIGVSLLKSSEPNGFAKKSVVTK